MYNMKLDLIGVDIMKNYNKHYIGTKQQQILNILSNNRAQILNQKRVKYFQAQKAQQDQNQDQQREILNEQYVKDFLKRFQKQKVPEPEPIPEQKVPEPISIIVQEVFRNNTEVININTKNIKKVTLNKKIFIFFFI